MIEAGIFDRDWVVIEQRDYASNGEIVVALIENFEATLKYIKQTAEQVLLIPAIANMTALSYRPEQVKIQGVLVGQMRSYRSLSSKLKRRTIMPKRNHMRDQVDANKVEAIMRHNYGSCSMEMWTVKFAVVGVFLLLGVYW